MDCERCSQKLLQNEEQNELCDYCLAAIGKKPGPDFDVCPICGMVWAENTLICKDCFVSDEVPPLNSLQI